MLNLIVAAVLLFGLVHAFLGIYVAVRHGGDMVGSHYHFALAWDWTVRLIKLGLILAAVLGFMLVMILGNGRFFFWDYTVVFFKTFWNLIVVIVTGFFQVMF